MVGEALEGVGAIRVVCNGGDLDPHDVAVAKAARDGQAALARTLVSAWQATEDGIDLLLARERYRRLHALLASRPKFALARAISPSVSAAKCLYGLADCVHRRACPGAARDVDPIRGC